MQHINHVAYEVLTAVAMKSRIPEQKLNCFCYGTMGNNNYPFKMSMGQLQEACGF
jgi:hypothetical protein